MAQILGLICFFHISLQQLLEDGIWEDDFVRKRKGRTLGPFRTPYFQNGVSFPPVNEDVKLKKSSGELSFEDVHESLTFNRSSRANLVEGVLENVREESMKPLMTRWVKLLGYLNVKGLRNKNLNNINLRFYKPNILAVLLYGAESWKAISSICRNLDNFKNKGLIL